MAMAKFARNTDTNKQYARCGRSKEKRSLTCDPWGSCCLGWAGMEAGEQKKPGQV